MKKKAKTGNLKSALIIESDLQDKVKSGLRALGNHSVRIDEGPEKVIDSLDFDEATKLAAPQEHRWDYFLGAGSCGIVGVEVHSATDGEVKVVIAKKRCSMPVLRNHLHDSVNVQRWVWIASGKVKFSPNSNAIRLLAKDNIEFEGRRLKLGKI